MAEAPLRLETHGGIAHLLLCHPPKNEMNARFVETFLDLVRSGLPGRGMRGLIVRGSGRHFSSGADTEELRGRLMGAEAASTPRCLLDLTMAFEALARLPVPVVAAVDGCCLGSGMELALACHYRVATPLALFSMPETTFELMPGVGGTARLPALIGVGRAIDLVLTGRALLADEARQIGLVDRIVERAALVSTAERIIERLSLGLDRSLACASC